MFCRIMGIAAQRVKIVRSAVWKVYACIARNGRVYVP